MRLRVRACGRSLGTGGSGQRGGGERAAGEPCTMQTGMMRSRAAESLGQVGAGNEAVVSALLEALHDADWDVRRRAAESLGRLEIKDTIQLRQVLVALNRCLYDDG